MLSLRNFIINMDKLYKVFLIILISVLTYLSLPTNTYAAALTGNTASLSDPTVNHTNTTYTITLSNVSLVPVRCIVIQFGLPGGANYPTGINKSSATLNNASTFMPTPSAWSIAAPVSLIYLTNASGETPASSSNRTLV